LICRLRYDDDLDWMTTVLLHLFRLLPFLRRRPPPAGPREPRPAPAARRLQANGATPEAPHD
jgi:hypothetical protein